MDEELARRARTIIRDRYADLGATLAGEKHFDRPSLSRPSISNPKAVE
ncbi:hypothetical protein [Burkholderia thailandensis]|nr:hypothetical protein [Burkholderia thailandensis]